MAIPTTPGAIVSSPLGGPGPFVSLFSPSTVPGAPATTLASPPLATDPTIPGTSLSCSADRRGSFAFRDERDRADNALCKCFHVHEPGWRSRHARVER